MQLVTIETAKLAKSKGFDWRCENYHKHPDSLHFRDDRTTIMLFENWKEAGQQDRIDNNKFNAACINWNEREGRTSYPHQSQLQKWLRNKHKIHITIFLFEEWQEDGNTLLHKYDFIIKQMLKFGTNIVSHKPILYDTYEEALEIALQESLKLID